MIDLREFRKANNLQQDDIADYLGVTKSFISQVENGKRDLPQSQLSKLLLNYHGWVTTSLQKKKENPYPGGPSGMDSVGRLQKIFEIYGIDAQHLVDKMELDDPKAIYDILNGKNKDISPKLAVKIISAFPEINKRWLLTGDGDVLNRMVSAEEIPENKQRKIPLYDDAQTIGGLNGVVANVDEQARVLEWIDAGDWFPSATSAIYHYGDSMVEYPSGSVLVLKRVNDPRLLINGEHYVIETSEFRVTKRILVKEDKIVAYSTNKETYPDGDLVYAPFEIPKEEIRHIDLVLGCVMKRFSNGAIRIK